jgi:RNA polymerase sigma-70 factor, ECF subfamily
LCAVDAETVIHEVFLRLLADETVRRRFLGGNLRRWLTQVVRNAAIDYYRNGAAKLRSLLTKMPKMMRPGV